MRTKTLFAVITRLLLIVSASTNSAVVTTVPISAELGTSIATDLFPVTIKLTPGNLFVTEPTLLFLDKERIGLQVRFQAYDHRPAQGIALSETGWADFSGKIGYDPATQQVLLHDPRIDKIKFDQKNDVTQRFLTQLNAAWSTLVTNPIRAELPPHPYLVPFKNNITDLSYDGRVINLAISYE